VPCHDRPRCDQGQAKGDIHRFAKACIFEYRQALVVVHGQYGIGLLQALAGKKGVGWERADQVQALCAQRVKHRFDDFDFLAAKMTTFAGMGVESGDENTRCGHAEACAQVVVENTADALQGWCGDRIGHGAQGQVRGGERHAQCTCGQHHHRMSSAEFSEELGMSAKRNARLVDNAFVYRAGHKPGQFAAQAGACGDAQRIQHIGGIGHVKLAGVRWGAQGDGINAQFTRVRQARCAVVIVRDEAQRQAKLCGACA